jgi:hypothetical protein
MKPKTLLWIFVAAALAAGAAPGIAAEVEEYVVAQLACPIKVSKIVAVYGPAGAKYKPGDYANLNPEGTEKLWLYAVIENATEDPVMSFTFDLLIRDAAGNELRRESEEFHFPLRDSPKSWEWSWVFDEAALATAVVFVPRVVNFPAGRKWEADEDYVELKLSELDAAD